jgi:hypothetical protein
MRNVIQAILLASFLPLAAGAANIPITNPGFEDGAVGPTIPGWTIDQQFAVVTSYGGSQVLDINIQDNDPSNPEAAVEQTLGSNFAAGDYTLALSVASIYNYQGYQGGLTAELRDGTNVLGSATFSPTDSNFQTLSFTTSIGAGDAAIGDPINIYFLHTDIGDVDIDNVSLTGPGVSPVPEPSSLAFMLTGLGAVGAAVRRRVSAARG